MKQSKQKTDLTDRLAIYQKCLVSGDKPIHTPEIKSTASVIKNIMTLNTGEWDKSL